MPSPHAHGADVAERLYVHGHSWLHRLPAHVKLIAMVLFIFTVVGTPPDQFWAFGVYAVLVITLVRFSGVPVRIIAPRMLIEVPFVIFALLMPFFGPAPNVEFLGLTLSQAGIIAGWGIIAKGTIGVVLSILLASTTPARDLLIGLEKLRVPPLLVQITSFMLRYIHVVVDEMHRMKIAREARGFQAKGVRSWPVLAHSAGALFIRSYERGERVHLAMLSRGYTGRLPQVRVKPPTRSQWLGAMALPALGLVVMITAIWVQS